eukprot:scpid103297/ scgid31656/ 
MPADSASGRPGSSVLELVEIAEMLVAEEAERVSISVEGGDHTSGGLACSSGGNDPAEAEHAVLVDAECAPMPADSASGRPGSSVLELVEIAEMLVAEEAERVSISVEGGDHTSGG